MWVYLAKRVAMTVLLWGGLSVLAFGLLWHWPGGCLSREGPWTQQYLAWLSRLVHMDLGYSCMQLGQSVWNVLFGNHGDRLGWTFALGLVTLASTCLIAVPMSIFIATRSESAAAKLFRGGSMVGLGVPPFLLALLLVAAGAPLGTLWPAALAIVVSQIAVIARHLRVQLLEILHQPFLQTVRAKGVSERVLLWKHALRNALQPLLSLLSLWMQGTFEGVLVATVVLQLPTVEGAFWEQGVNARDPAVLVAGLLFFGGVLLIGNLLVDLARVSADPRIRYAD